MTLKKTGSLTLVVYKMIFFTKYVDSPDKVNENKIISKTLKFLILLNLGRFKMKSSECFALFSEIVKIWGSKNSSLLNFRFLTEDISVT